MEPTPIWLLPPGFNANEAEGRRAFEAGKPVDANPYGESSAAKEWEQGWRRAEARSKEKLDA